MLTENHVKNAQQWSKKAFVLRIGAPLDPQVLPKFFCITNGQKFMILSNKNIPPSPKKLKKIADVFFFLGGSPIFDVVNSKVTLQL
jgi:hypothetical protein